MASRIKNCKHCKVVISPRARRCPNCGRSCKRGNPSWLIALILVVLTGAVLYLARGIDPWLDEVDLNEYEVNDPEVTKSDRQKAWANAKSNIISRIERPDTAVFPDLDNDHAAAMLVTNGIWHVWGYVDIPEAGEMMRKEWEVYTSHSPGTDLWTLEFMRFGAETSGHNPRETIHTTKQTPVRN